MRWIFHDIRDGSFAWRNEVNDDDAWRIQQTFSAIRLATQGSSGLAEIRR